MRTNGGTTNFHIPGSAKRWGLDHIHCTASLHALAKHSLTDALAKRTLTALLSRQHDFARRGCLDGRQLSPLDGPSLHGDIKKWCPQKSQRSISRISQELVNNGEHRLWLPKKTPKFLALLESVGLGVFYFYSLCIQVYI
jgi:hypothetical protein